MKKTVLKCWNFFWKIIFWSLLKVFASLKKIVTGGRCSLRGILDVSDHSLNIMERPSHKGNF